MAATGNVPGLTEPTLEKKKEPLTHTRERGEMKGPLREHEERHEDKKSCKKEDKAERMGKERGKSSVGKGRCEVEEGRNGEFGRIK